MESRRTDQIELEMRNLCENVITDIEYIELRLVEALKMSCGLDDFHLLKERLSRIELCIGEVSANLSPSRCAELKQESDDESMHTPSSLLRDWRKEHQ